VVADLHLVIPRMIELLRDRLSESLNAGERGADGECMDVGRPLI
jgi:hypothetical protein